MTNQLKKYHTLGEFVVDYRKHRSLTQIDLAAMLDVDVRTIIRWEKNESLIKPNKERILIENLGVPHQVIRNLNTDQPIPVYFDFNRWIYSLTLLTSMVRHVKEFRTDEELFTSRFETLKEEVDFEFIIRLQKNQKKCTPLKTDVLKLAAKLLPDLNFVIRDQSGYHGGHTAVLPLKYEVYEKIRDQLMDESQLTTSDLTPHQQDMPVFYFYSIYSNSLDNSYYVVNKLLYFFKKRESLTDYIFSGITNQKVTVERFRESGFDIVWQKQIDKHPDHISTFLSGNFNWLIGENN